MGLAVRAILPLLLAAGLAMSVAQAQPIPDAAPQFSAPCEPESRVVACESTPKVVSKVDAASPVVAHAPLVTAGQYREGLAALSARLLVAVAYPPAFRRPPPF